MRSDLDDLTVVNSALGDKLPTNAAKAENVSDTGSTLIKPKLQGIFKLAVFQKGKFFGEDDLLNHRKHLGTITCTSAKGTLFRMTTKVFDNKILSKYESNQEIRK